MDVSDSSAESWLDIAQTIEVQQDLSSCPWQDETVKSGKVVDDPICLFGQFVSAVSSNALKDRTKVRVKMRLLYCSFGKANYQ